MKKILINLGDKYFQVGESLILEKMELILFLINNLDVFAWSPCEALGVDLEFICHRLNVDPQCPPKKKRPRRSSDVHVGAMKEEVDRLKEVGAIKEVYYPEWLANMVLVKKKNGK